MRKTSEIVAAFFINILAGIAVWSITKKWEVVLVFIPFTITVFALFYFFISFRNIGITSWSNKRGRSPSFRKCLSEAAISVDFLATWGGSIPSLSPYIERTFVDLINRGCKFRFLILKPGSHGVIRRRRTRGSWPPGQPETDIRWFLNIKESLQHSPSHFRIALYSEEPIWSMVIVDNKKAIVGFYGKGVGRDNPGITLTRLFNKPSFLEPYIMEYERVWANAEELQSISDLEHILQPLEHSKTDGFIIAITGPSGAGKTTLTNLLAKKRIGKPSVTVTTRSPRDDEQSDGDYKQYKYVSKEAFRVLATEGKLLCESEFCSNNYGIETKMVFEVVESGKILLLDTIIAPQILKKRLGAKVVTIFVSPRSLKTVTDRIDKKSYLTREERDIRIEHAKSQMEEAIYCDYVVFTDQGIKETLQTLELIIENIAKSYKYAKNIHPEKIAYLTANVVLREKAFIIEEV